MEKAFVYGMSVGGNNFTDRIEETKRVKLDFEMALMLFLYLQDAWVRLLL